MIEERPTLLVGETDVTAHLVTRTVLFAVGVALIALLVVLAGAWNDPPPVIDSQHDDEIIRLALEQYQLEGDFNLTAIDPVTSDLDWLRYYESRNLLDWLKSVVGSERKICDDLAVADYDLCRLVDALVERNKTQFVLSIDTSRSNHYIVDYDSTLLNYFAEGGGGWEKWYEEHPEVGGITSISLPVMDSEAGIVLIYIGTQYHGLWGSGWLIAYSYRDGQLIELSRKQVWIS